MELFDASQHRIMPDLARATIQSAFEGVEASLPTEDFLMLPSGVFVTLRIQEDLRGCIGSLEPQLPLGYAIVKAAMGAAFHDPRFAPLTPEEWKNVNVEISVLSPLKTITDIEEIEIGRHGILLSVGYSRGLLLPQVATEYGWDRLTFLKHTCQKAGLPEYAWKLPGAKIEIFSAEVFGEADSSRTGD